MADTGRLIAQLAETATVVRPSRPFALFARWLAGSLAYMGALLLLFGLRGDLPLKLHAPLFLAETGLLACMMIGAGISAVMLSFPDLYQKRWLIFAPLLPLALFLIVLCLAWQADKPPAPKPEHGIECLLCIVMFSTLPAAGMFYILRKQASTHRYLAGGIALLAASSMGCLTLRLSEKTDSISHLVEWHYLPMAGFALLGVWLGGRILRW